MTLPSAETLVANVHATWPAATTSTAGGFHIRQSDGGGSRVTAATVAGETYDIPTAEAAMQDIGQTPLFMVWSGHDALDGQLATAGYTIKDPTLLMAAPISPLCADPPAPITCFEVWPPLATQKEIWAEGGLGPAKLAVMDRAACPKTSILGRINDRPAAAAYVGLSHDCAMIHGLEVSPRDRRQGLASLVTRSAAIWGANQGAKWLTLAVVKANTGAQALYTSLGMAVVGQYHYRIKPDA